jgi:hypothetical protein
MQIKIITSDIVENDQINRVNLEIVGYFFDRDRLVQRWVAEMLLNAQSESLYLRYFKYTKALCKSN